MAMSNVSVKDLPAHESKPAHKRTSRTRTLVWFDDQRRSYAVVDIRVAAHTERWRPKASEDYPSPAASDRRHRNHAAASVVKRSLGGTDRSVGPNAGA